MQRTDLLEKTQMLGKVKGRRRWGQKRMRWLDGISNSNEHEFGQVPGDGVEKAMATHSSTLTWKIPWTKEPDRL